MRMTLVNIVSSINIKGGVTSPKGFFSGGTHCGLRRKKLDFGWLYSSVPAKAAAVYTQNAFQAAPLKVTQESIAEEQKLQLIVVNSANANACTGKQGLENARLTRKYAAEEAGLPEHLVAVQSTGLIGVQLPMDKVETGIRSINLESQDAASFERAILTTDTCTKHASVECEIEGKQVTIGGAAKGSGMIDPNMATMLAYITTDADVSQDALKSLLKKTTDKTYNQITVDGDSSTNDTVVVLANGAAGTTEFDESHPEWGAFEEAFTKLSQELAKKIARDGEGATKLIEVQIEGAATPADAGKIAKSIISSNLVKTAIHGADPNWGRIVCAAGYSGASMKSEAVDVYLGPIQVVSEGLPLDFDEPEASAYLTQSDIHIKVKLEDGTGAAQAWGCDLSYEYVRINASYRT
ncbi:bifunctional glutamate N-acetyltransferase/amino-acid acetyltransferase ArgJ [Alkalicoccus luteus]|uniref:bifunctional glutamate N-acetyltransferase/amino-acid acetyltransferase ArgJ n=1 Tax=Alkalicoccus luteus TaxID=1237094 RepID=UPI00403349A6